MTEPTQLTTAGVNLTLDPAGVTLDAQGRIQLADARVLSALLTARPATQSAEDSNMALCGGNGYQCACPSSLQDAGNVINPGP